ncbi:DNA primase, partial [Streptomyces sp. SID7982]|nr:DNA primase [Streptomyces sp. SID7982]
MTSPGNDDTLFSFDAQAVAAQIRQQAPTLLPAQAALPPTPAEATQQGLLPDTLTDRGNAKLFVKLYANDYRHVPGMGWYRWDTTRWQIDEDDTVLWAAGDLAESIASSDPRGLFTSQALQQHRRRALSTTGMGAMLTQAKAAPGMVLNAARLDADPYALCTPDGIVDLRTGLLKSPDPNKDFHSRSTTVGPRATAIPRWNRFLTDTFGDDAEGAEMIDFLQLLLGYSVTGDVGGQILPFLFGSGKNGKSVLLDVLMRLLGDYADAAPPGFLMARPYE